MFIVIIYSINLKPGIKAELLGHQALFPARTEIELCDEIINAIGSPNENIWPGYSQLPFFKNYNCKVMRRKI